MPKCPRGKPNNNTRVCGNELWEIKYEGPWRLGPQGDTRRYIAYWCNSCKDWVWERVL